MNCVHLPEPEKTQTDRYTKIGLSILDEQPSRLLPLPFDVLKYFEARPLKVVGWKQEEISISETKDEVVPTESCKSPTSIDEENHESCVIVINVSDEESTPTSNKLSLKYSTKPGCSRLLFENPTGSLATR